MSQHREWALRAEADLAQTRVELAASRAKVLNLRALVVLFRQQRFRSVLKRIVTGSAKKG